MPTLTLINSDPIGAVWLDARFSNGGAPFAGLSKVPGFPRWLGDGGSIKIETENWKEVLYLRSFKPSPPDVNPPILPNLWRISLGSGNADRIGRIFKTGISEYHSGFGPWS